MNPPTSVPADPTDWRLVLDVIQMLLGIFLGLYVWIMSKSKVTEDRIYKNEMAVNRRFIDLSEGVDSRQDKFATRLAKIEGEMGAMPTRQSIGNLHTRLDRVQQAQAQTQGELKGMHKTLDLIHSHMMEGK